jgi:hypothetical protein
MQPKNRFGGRGEADQWPETRRLPMLSKVNFKTTYCLSCCKDDMLQILQDFSTFFSNNRSQMYSMTYICGLPDHHLLFSSETGEFIPFQKCVFELLLTSFPLTPPPPPNINHPLPPTPEPPLNEMLLCWRVTRRTPPQ